MIDFAEFYYSIAASTCVSFLFLFWVVLPYSSNKIFPKYASLNTSDKITWRCSINSLLHSTIVGIWSVYSMITDEEMYLDNVWGDSVLVRSSCAVVLGFMLADSILLMVYDKEIGQRPLLFHHLVTIFADYFVVIQGVFPYFANFRLSAELSTPFVRLWWILKALGYDREHLLSRLNFYTMLMVFGGTRILTIPIFWSLVRDIHGTYEFEQLGHMGYILIGMCVILDILNCLWFSKMLLMCKKTAAKPKED